MAGQEDHHRLGDDAAIRQLLLPTRLDQLGLLQLLYVAGQCKGGHIRFDAVDDGAGLHPRRAIAGANGEILAGPGLPVCFEPGQDAVVGRLGDGVADHQQLLGAGLRAGLPASAGAGRLSTTAQRQTADQNAQQG